MQAAGGCRSIQAPHVRPRCLKSCRSEPGCVKGVSCSLLARLRVELHHLGGRPCQLAHPSGMFKEAYRNLTRNLLSSVNLLVSPQLLSTCSLAHSSRQRRAAGAAARRHCLWLTQVLLLWACSFAACCFLLPDMFFCLCMFIFLYF